MSLRTIILTFSFVLFCVGTYSQDNRILSGLAGLTENHLEGYESSSGWNDFSYHSFRSELSESMISRCTDGKMSIQWKTQTITNDEAEGGASFAWIAAMDQTKESHQFEVLVNGKLRFTIESGKGADWKIKGDGGGVLSFITVELDQHNDAHGYMLLDVPEEWLTPGEPVEVRITGSNDNSNTWIIVYKANDALEHLRNSSLYNIDFDIDVSIDNRNLVLYCKFPLNLTAKVLRYEIGSKKGSLVFKAHPDSYSFAQLSVRNTNRDISFRIYDDLGDILTVNSINTPDRDLKIFSDAVISSTITKIKSGSFNINGSRKFNKGTSLEIKALSSSNLSKGKIYLMNSSHQDIAWMDTPEKCVIERDTMLLMPLFSFAQSHPDYRFDIEDALMLKEFLSRHPEMITMVKDLLESGRLSCGSTYIQPYEEMYSGESLARQFYFGARWLKETFDYDADTYWNVDVPGRTLQMAQIMAKAGTKNLMISRFEKGFYDWYSPDGSHVTTYSSGHYASSFGALQRNFFESSRSIASDAQYWERYYHKSENPAIPLLSDWDMSPAIDYSDLINSWKAISGIEDRFGNSFNVTLPAIEQVIAPDFFDSLRKEADNIPSIRGERPAVWLYIHGPSHYEALKLSRKADIKLITAEKFSSILTMLSDKNTLYPSKELARAWEAKIFPDHGWGGKGGEITDMLFYSKYATSLHIAEKIVDESLDKISSFINFDDMKGEPIVVFNSLSWERNDIVKFNIVFNSGELYNGVNLFDDEGQAVDSQLSEKKYNNNGSLSSATLIFQAESVPSIGYKTYYYKYVDKEIDEVATGTVISEIENEHYFIELNNRGITRLLDKNLGKEIINTNEISGGEVFTMNSVGNGAGEFSDIQKPDMKGYDYTGSSGVSEPWILTESGDVFSRIEIKQDIKHATVKRTITIFHSAKKIDFDIELLNWEGILYREFRFALPLCMADAKVAYEVPFGVVEVGKDEINGAAGERYTTDCSDIHPRGIQNWIGASNSEIGVTLSSDVVVADYIDPRDNGKQGVVLQPILLASRKSCHWEGNDYLQTGNHRYHFSLSSHKPGWENGYKFGVGANDILMAVNPIAKYDQAKLPEEKSFVSLDSPNVMVSTLKKSEDGDGLIIRLVEMEGKDTSVNLVTLRPIQNIRNVSLIEYNNAESAIMINKNKISIGHNSINTFRFNIQD